MSFSVSVSLAAPSPLPQRVDKNASVSVRTQIKYAKMRKAAQKTHITAKNISPNAFRRVKSLDYDDVRKRKTVSDVGKWGGGVGVCYRKL